MSQRNGTDTLAPSFVVGIGALLDYSLNIIAQHTNQDLYKSTHLNMDYGLLTHSTYL